MLRRIFLLAALLAPLAVSAAQPITFAVISVVRPGDDGALMLPGGPVWTLGAAGQIYRDGVLSSGAAKVLLLFGDNIYSQGKTTPAWWRWSGSRWEAATLNLDALVAIALAAPPPSASGVVSPMAAPRRGLSGKAGTPR